MSASPDISVVIPTFRRPAEVAEAVRSVLAQEGASVEVHVFDDSPAGESEGPIRAIGDARVHWQRHEPPTGGVPGIVRNEGFRKTRGRFLHFLDDDDIVPPATYRAFLEAFRQHPEVGMAFGRIEPFGPDPDAIRHERRYFESAERRARLAMRLKGVGRWWLVANQVFRQTMLVNSSAMIRREAFERLGGYDTKIRLVEDVDFYGRAMREVGCLFLDRVVLNYRITSSSLMHKKRETDEAIHNAYRIMHSNYRSKHGTAEFLVLKTIARTVGRLVA